MKLIFSLVCATAFYSAYGAPSDLLIRSSEEYGGVNYSWDYSVGYVNVDAGNVDGGNIADYFATNPGTDYYDPSIQPGAEGTEAPIQPAFEYPDNMPQETTPVLSEAQTVGYPWDAIVYPSMPSGASYLWYSIEDASEQIVFIPINDPAMLPTSPSGPAVFDPAQIVEQQVPVEATQVSPITQPAEAGVPVYGIQQVEPAPIQQAAVPVEAGEPILASEPISPMEPTEPLQSITPTQEIPPAQPAKPVAIPKPIAASTPIPTEIAPVVEPVQTTTPVNPVKPLPVAKPAQPVKPMQTASPVQVQPLAPVSKPIASVTKPIVSVPNPITSIPKPVITAKPAAIAAPIKPTQPLQPMEPIYSQEVPAYPISAQQPQLPLSIEDMPPTLSAENLIPTLSAENFLPAYSNELPLYSEENLMPVYSAENVIPLQSGEYIVPPMSAEALENQENIPIDNEIENLPTQADLENTPVGDKLPSKVPLNEDDNELAIDDELAANAPLNEDANELAVVDDEVEKVPVGDLEENELAAEELEAVNADKVGELPIKGSVPQAVVEKDDEKPIAAVVNEFEEEDQPALIQASDVNKPAQTPVQSNPPKVEEEVENPLVVEEDAVSVKEPVTNTEVANKDKVQMAPTQDQMQEKPPKPLAEDQAITEEKAPAAEDAQLFNQENNAPEIVETELQATEVPENTPIKTPNVPEEQSSQTSPANEMVEAEPIVTEAEPTLVVENAEAKPSVNNIVNLPEVSHADDVVTSGNAATDYLSVPEQAVTAEAAEKVDETPATETVSTQVAGTVEPSPEISNAADNSATIPASVTVYIASSPKPEIKVPKVPTKVEKPAMPSTTGEKQKTISQKDEHSVAKKPEVVSSSKPISQASIKPKPSIAKTSVAGKGAIASAKPIMVDKVSQIVTTTTDKTKTPKPVKRTPTKSE